MMGDETDFKTSLNSKESKTKIGEYSKILETVLKADINIRPEPTAPIIHVIYKLKDNSIDMKLNNGGLLKGPQSAYLKFTGEMLEAFMILTDSMLQKGDEQLLSHGKFKQTYSEGVDELKIATDFEATEYNSTLANQLKNDLAAVAKPNTPANIVPFMKEMVDICSNYLAQYAEFNKDKGPAFRLLLKAMRGKANEQLYQKGKARRTYGKAAKELDDARGLENDHDDPNLSQEIHSNLSKLVEKQTPPDLKTDMAETLDICSKYLSQCAVDEIERGPAFDILIKELEKHGADQFTHQFKPLSTKFAAAYTLKSAPGLCGVSPDPATSPIFSSALHKAVDPVTPKALSKDMHEVIERCANYLSAFVRDRDKALQSLLKMMKSNPKKELAKRNNYTMDYGTGATEIEAAPLLVPFMPIKDIADEAKANLSKDMEGSTKPEMRLPMKALIQDASKYLSQPIAIRSGVAGERYPLNFLSAVKKSLGSRPLFKYKSFGYKALVQVALISEMQKRGNEILIEVEGAAETFFFAAQRLKKAKSLEAKEPCSQVAYTLTKKLEDMIRCRSMARKLTSAMKDHIKEASDFLSAHVTKPDEEIEAYVSLLSEMETAGDGRLIEGEIPKTYKDAAAYLRQLTSFQDQICQPNTSLQATTEGKLKSLMANDAARGFSKSVMDGVITDSTGLLVSYIMLQGIKTEALKVLIEHMDTAGSNVLLRHGTLRKTYSDGADILRPKNTDQLGVPSADPVVARKIQIKLRNLMYSCTPDKYKEFMDDVIEDATMYLAVHFLQPQLIKVCKCMKNVFVQCELWCDEILRRVARPCCTCSRHVSAQALADLAGGARRGAVLGITQCPSRRTDALHQQRPPLPCPAPRPTEECKGASATTSYLLYSTEPFGRHSYFRTGKLPFQSPSDSLRMSTPKIGSPIFSPARSIERILTEDIRILERREDAMARNDNGQDIETSSPSFHTPVSQNSGSPVLKPETQFWQSPTTMFARVHTKINSSDSSPTRMPRRMSVTRRGYNARAPIVTTDQMGDWHAMMVSLMWNVQAWRDWIQENRD